MTENSHIDIVISFQINNSENYSIFMIEFQFPFINKSNLTFFSGLRKVEHWSD